MNKLTTQEIEMFENAIEIQEMWQFLECDVVYPVKYDRDKGYLVEETRFWRCAIFDDFGDVDLLYSESYQKDNVWIPTQEQMWDMVADCPSPGTLMDFLVLECGWNGQTYSIDWARLRTLRATILEYVMKKKFGKFWNGKDWEAVI